MSFSQLVQVNKKFSNKASNYITGQLFGESTEPFHYNTSKPGRHGYWPYRSDGDGGRGHVETQWDWVYINPGSKSEVILLDLSIRYFTV